MIKFLIISLFFFNSIFVHSQEKVSFKAKDGLKITADLYIRDYYLPYIIMFHQANSSRGEYHEIAEKLSKLDYNCLAVDLRNGDEENYISNETAARAKEENFSNSQFDALLDISAAIDYIKEKNKKPVVLFGSGYSASLCLLEAKKRNDVNAVIAFSPGEFFTPAVQIKDSLYSYNKQTFIASSTNEYSYVKEMTKNISPEYLSLVECDNPKSNSGAKMLLEKSEKSESLWLELIVFFNKLKNNTLK